VSIYCLHCTIIRPECIISTTLQQFTVIDGASITVHYCDVTDNIALKTDNGVVSTVDKALQTGAGKLTNCVDDKLNGQCTGHFAYTE